MRTLAPAWLGRCASDRLRFGYTRSAGMHFATSRSSALIPRIDPSSPPRPPERSLPREYTGLIDNTQATENGLRRLGRACPFPDLVAERCPQFRRAATLLQVPT